ncbi:DNA helicase [Gordonia phage BlueNGold]|nr:DNA helicase [Gordonia phage BlueNGold]
MTKVVARLDDRHPNKIVVESAYEHREEIQKFLARKWSPGDTAWILPLAWSSCIQLRTAFGDNLEIKPDLLEWSLEYYSRVVQPSLTLRELAKLEDSHAHLNDVTEQAIKLEDELKLFPHQVVGGAFMATNMGCGIFDETGTGKSAQTISALRAAHRAGDKDIFPVMIVAPNSVKMTWKREWQKWWPGIIVHLVDGSAAERRKVFETPGHVYIVNYEQMHRHSRLARYGNVELKRCVACGGLDEKITNAKCEIHERELNQIKFQTVVCDEAHRMLHPSKQTRAIWSVSDKAARRYALTGTPIQDNLNDFWFILRYIRPDEFPSKTRYVDRYADTGYSQWGVLEIYGVKKDREEEFEQITRPLMRRMLKKIVLPFLPPIIRETRYIDLTAPQRKAYRQMKKDAYAVLDKGKFEEAFSADNPLSVATRLLQFASCYGEIVEVETPKVKQRRVDAVNAGLDPNLVPLEQQLKLRLPSNKISAFMNDIESGDFGESSIVVFAESRQLIELLSLEMTRKGYEHGLITGAQTTEERQAHIDNFQANKIKYILVTIQAGGVGLTLTAADTNVFLQRAYSSTAMKQALSRSHRIGSEIHDRVTIIDYVSNKTIEEKQIDALLAKDGRIEEILKDKALLRKFLEEE